MIRRLYVDNFRSLVDFTWEPGKETLVLGYNGSGKTSVLDALDVLRTWAGSGRSRVRVESLLGSRELTRWRDDDAMRFECEIKLGHEVFLYKLTFDCSDYGGVPLVDEESLQIGDEIVFSRRGVMASVSTGEAHPASEYPVPLGQSALSAIAALPNSDATRRFASALSDIVIVRPIPPLMKKEATRPEAFASPHFENFVAWYWSLSANGGFQRAMLGLLNDAWEEFDYLKLEEVGRLTMVLGAVFKRSSASLMEFSLDFDELSDGERMLVVLYSLVAYQKSQPSTTIIIDEPGNFVSLLEIQPWLLKMLDTCPDHGQLILVSHNEEIIQTMGRENVVYFSRKDHLSPTTVRKIRQDEVEVAPLKDLLRRGWLDE